MADHDVTPDSAHPIAAKLEILLPIVLRVAPNHATGLIDIELLTEPSVRLALTPEAAWWLSLGIARATMVLRGPRP